MTEQLRGPDRVPVAEQMADGAGGHRLSLEPERRQDTRGEAAPGPELGEERRGAQRVMAEGVVEAHHHLAGTQGAHENVVHERLRLHAGEFQREGNDERRVGPQSLHALEVVVEGGDGPRGTLRPQHAHGMRIERAYHRGQAEGAPTFHGGADQQRVTEVDAVEGAQRGDTRAQIRRVGRETAEYPHGGGVRA